MSRYTSPQRHLKAVPAEVSKRPGRPWLIAWNILLFVLAICFMVMSVWSQWFCVPVLALAPLVYICFVKEENCRLHVGNSPREQRIKELRLMLSIAFAVAFLVFLRQF